MLGKDKDRGLKEVAELTRPDSRGFPAKLAASQTWVLKRPRKRQAQPLGTAGSQSSQQTGGQGAQMVCKALVQTLDKQLGLSQWCTVNAGMCCPCLLLCLCPSAFAPRPREGQAGRGDSMLRQKPA